MEIKIGERVIPLRYTVFDLIEIQKVIGCTGYQLKDEVFGIRQEDEDDPMSIRFDCVTDGHKLENLVKLIRILGNGGLKKSGQEPDLTDEWVAENIKPGQIIAYALVMMGVINEGNRAEMQKEEGPVDEVLEEQNAKK